MVPCLWQILTCQGTPSGIILASGRSWKQQRRFGIMTLRNLGMGKKGLEHRVQEEASHLVEFFGNLKGRPVDPSFPLFHSISNVICAVVFGYHFSDEDKTFHELIHATEKIFKFRIHGTSCVSLLQMYEILPWLLCRLPGPHKKVLAFLTQRAYGKTKFSVFYFNFYHHLQSKEGAKPKYDEENLVYVINDLFLGGSETSSTTLYWGLLYMVKVQKELDAVLGPSQLICYEDRRKLPYTNAVVHEIQRFSNIVFVGVPRLCVRNTTLLGFPKEIMLAPHGFSLIF
uniref:Uncharacterized protein n=1 Tax=Junco hyemalis TaxID=40217 RepID=A0A8C5J6G3_JUNHY